MQGGETTNSEQLGSKSSGDLMSFMREFERGKEGNQRWFVTE